jgi:ribosomal protein S12
MVQNCSLNPLETVLMRPALSHAAQQRTLVHSTSTQNIRGPNSAYVVLLTRFFKTILVIDRSTVEPKQP